MAASSLSSLGFPVVSNEENVPFSLIRKGFVLTTFFLGLFNFMNTIWMFQKSRETNVTIHSRYFKQNKNALLAVTLTYLLHAVIHTFHYMDNITRPVDYHEPWWLYRQYLLSPMEITFFFNFPHTYFGTTFLRGLYEKGMIDSMYLIFFVYSALMTVMHYNAEVPSAYSFLVNLSIAGEGISIVLFLAATFVIKQQPENSDQLQYKLITLALVAIFTGVIVITSLGLSSLSLIVLLIMGVIVSKTLEAFQSLEEKNEEDYKI
jgi:hypothetical protein